MKKRIIWGSLGSLREFGGGDHQGTALHVRKPHTVDLDATYGARLSVKEIDALREKAIKAGTPEARLEDGFHEDVFACTISDETQDRYGDRIEVAGWDIADYRKNPVLLFGHDYESKSVGHGLEIYSDSQNPGTTEERKRLRGLFMWSRANPEARILKALYGDGDMRAFSVGFIPKEFHVPNNDEERDALGLGEWGVLHQKQVLLENSAVPVPANPNAITEESVKAFRGVIREEDVPGLRMLEERLREVNMELSKSIGLFLPSKKTLFEVRHAISKLRTSLAPGTLDQEDTKPKGDDEQVTNAQTATADKKEAKVIPDDVSTELAPTDASWVPLTEEDFPSFDTLGEDERTLVAGFFAYADQLPPQSFDQLYLGHHNPADGTVSLEGVMMAIEAINSRAEEASGIPEDELQDAFAHLAAHLEAFGVDVPAFDPGEPPPADATASKGTETGGNAEGADTSEKKDDTPEVAAAAGQLLDALGLAGGNEALTKALSAAIRTSIVDIHSSVGLDGEVEQRVDATRKWRVVRAHRPDVAPEDEVYSRADWDKAVGEDFSLRRNTSLIYDENDQKNPKAYLMPHHKAEEGTPVVWSMVKRAMNLLFSKAVEGKVPEGVRRRAYYHLRTHYSQFDKEAPSFRSMEQLAQLAGFLQDAVIGLTSGDEEASSTTELMLDFVYSGYMSASDKAYEIQALTFDTAKWEKEDAKAWAQNHGFDVSNLSEVEGRYVFAQLPETRFVSKGLNEQPVEGEDGDGVALRAGRLKNPVHLLSEEIAGLREELSNGFAEFRTLKSNGGPKAAAFIKSLMDSKEDDNFVAIIEGSKQLAEANNKLKRALNPKKE